jgi:two-component system, NtrC family, sensor histidine kinase PilS
LSDTDYDRFFPAPQSSLWTSLRYFSLSRVFIALVMSLLLPVSIPNLEIAQPYHFQSTAFVYLGLALLFGILARRAWPGFYPQLLVQISADIALLGLLTYFAGEQKNGLSLLLLVPVAAAAVLSSRRLSFFFAAMASLVLLIVASLHSALGRPDSFMPAGLLGVALFALAWMINSLAGRISAQEEVVRLAEQELRNQQAVNQMVIAELTYGVVVLDPQAMPRFMNRAAADLLTLDPGTEVQQVLQSQAWIAVMQACQRWLVSTDRSPQPSEMKLIYAAQDAHGQATRRRVRLRFLAAPEAGDTVILIEDTDHLEQRAQQLKLASMGRLSASIAHEIRNPLGAIRHANSLLQETLSRSAEQSAMARRFTDIVEKNSLRINRIVEDVLGLVRRDKTDGEPINFAQFMEHFLPEFIAGDPALQGQQGRIRVQINTSREFYFDPHHLRQVLINLLSNACRYSSDAVGAVVVSLSERGAATDAKLELRISDDGPGLSPEVAAHVFEPFHTTEARGTGLGLFLAQELCVTNMASIQYECPPMARETGFVIRPRAVVAMPQKEAAAGAPSGQDEPHSAAHQ